MTLALMVGFGAAAVFFAWLAYREQNRHVQTMDELGKVALELEAVRAILAGMAQRRPPSQVAGALLDRLSRERQERLEQFEVAE